MSALVPWKHKKHRAVNETPATAMCLISPEWTRLAVRVLKVFVSTFLTLTDIAQALDVCARTTK